MQKTLTVHLRGGLGNQLFQFACGLSLSKTHNMNLKLNVNWFHDHPAQETHRTFDLLSFNINTPTTIITTKGKDILDGQGRFKYFPIAIPNDNCNLYGYWVDAKYFSNVEDVLRNIIVIKKTEQIDIKHSDLLKNIKNKNSVAVHVRRTDFLNDKRRMVCNRDYYNKQIYNMQNEVDDTILIFFSDDIDWVKSNIPTTAQSIYISNNSTIEDFYLMSQCNNHILSNSTFGWWAAWKANTGGIVLYPKKWKTIHNTNTFYTGVPDNWR